VALCRKALLAEEGWDEAAVAVLEAEIQAWVDQGYQEATDEPRAGAADLLNGVYADA
jgi:TPP-dependent pyruvate/acetoin dehydrogenase alpha subunit